MLAGAGIGWAPAARRRAPARADSADARRLLTIRHAGIAIALAALAPLISTNLTSTIDTAREQGTAAVLDAKLPPQDKIEIAPDLFGGLNTDDPRGELRKSIAKARAGLDGEEATELGNLGDRLDEVVTGAVRSAFRPTFIITSALALLAALILLTGAGRAAVMWTRPAVATAAIAALLAAAGYGIAYANSTRDGPDRRSLPGPGAARRRRDQWRAPGHLAGRARPCSLQVRL